MSDDRNRDWPFPGPKRYASLAERMKDVGNANAERGREVLAARAAMPRAPMPREPQLLNAADLRRIVVAHDRMVSALRQFALSGGRGKREAAAVAEAERRWDSVTQAARDKLDPGVGRDFG